MKIIVFNGPSGSGKDTLIDGLAKRITNRDVLYFTPKHLLCEYVAAKYNLHPKSIWQMNADREIRWDKLDILGGLSVVEALIDVSENDIKKTYDETGVVRLALSDFIEQNYYYLENSVILIDCGFNSEYPIYAETLATETHLVRITREGYNFDNDSREFIDNPKIILKNDGTIDEFLDYAIPLIISECGLHTDKDLSKGVKFTKDI